jgi:hypothetical protein
MVQRVCFSAPGASDTADKDRTPRTAAQSVAEIASSVEVEPKFTTPASAAADSMRSIVRRKFSASHGYTIMKITDMHGAAHSYAPGRSEESSILLVLDAAA